MTLHDYLSTPESNQRRELLFGLVREPAAPTWGHQAVVLRLARLLDGHVRRRRLGSIGLSPVDVVFDRQRHLVLQPDLLFVSAARGAIIDDRVWGAPDLVVEVLSYGTRVRDTREKLLIYAGYGVGECWLVDSIARSIEIYEGGDSSGWRNRTVFAGDDVVVSRHLPQLRLRMRTVFG